MIRISYFIMRHLLVLFLTGYMLLSCGGRNGHTGTAAALQTVSTVAKNQQPTRYGYRIVKIFPHDTKSYTQGLLWHNGYLYEGTGEYGRSALKKVELSSGKTVQEHPLERRFFGEGIALLDGKIYQLTWREGKVFIYDAETFEKTGEFVYGGEGWGLTTDGEKLYMSDGSSLIRVIDPATFQCEKTIPVRETGSVVENLNELEWIDGAIWANVYLTDRIVIIDPATGQVTGTIDMKGLLGPADITYDTDVLNGIAWDPENRRLFVTGKNWNKLFEVELIEKH